jgi:hypothetical protein
MKRVEEIKNKRQAHHIFERMRKAKAIERQKDIREVQRDIALIKSPAAGMKRSAKVMEVDEEVEGVASDTEIDTSINVKPKKRSRQVARVVEVVQESDNEMEEN